MSRRRILLAYSSLTNTIQTIPNNEIWYTSTDGNVVTPYATDVFGANIVSNTYSDGRGIITFDGNVTTIGDNAFQYCESLTNVTIPNSVTSIGKLAFYYCGSLTNVTIPDSVTSIGNNIFNGCYGLTSVTIPNSVTSIGYGTFLDCSSLTSVYCKATTPPALGSNSFDDNGSGRKIYVPYQSLNAYKTTTNWSVYANDIVGYDFENDNLITFTIDNVEYYAEEGMTWKEWCDSKYNVDEFWCDSNYVRIRQFDMVIDITPSDIICNGCEYNILDGSGAQ